MPDWVWPTMFSAFVAGVGGLYVKISDRLRSIESRMDVVDTKVRPMWAQVEAKLVGDLHHAHAPEMDRLLERLLALTITEPERLRLHQMLIERSTDLATPQDERESAILMINVMKKVRLEAASIAENIVNTAIVSLFAVSSSLAQLVRNWR